MTLVAIKPHIKAILLVLPVWLILSVKQIMETLFILFKGKSFILAYSSEEYSHHGTEAMTVAGICLVSGANQEVQMG